ncbi:MAG: hypothetical protein ACI4FZ_04710 [Lachnospiraceae bacterium]
MKKKLAALLCAILVLASFAGCGAKETSLQIGQVVYGAHGTKCFSVITAVVSGDKIVKAFIDEYQYFGVADDITGVPNSDAGFGESFPEGKVLGSKRVNNGYYSSHMAEAAGSTVELVSNYNAIQSFAEGKTISEVEAAVNGKEATAVVDAVSGATLVDTPNYLLGIVAAAKAAQNNTAVSFKGDISKLSLNQVDGAAHGTKCFAVTTVLTDGEQVVLTWIDEYQFMDKAAEGVVGVPNSDAGFGDNFPEGKVLASKRQSNVYYSAHMAEAAGATVELAKNYDAIQAYCNGKTVAELKELVAKDKTAVVDAVSGATLVDTAGYIQTVIDAVSASK